MSATRRRLRSRCGFAIQLRKKTGLVLNEQNESHSNLMPAADYFFDGSKTLSPAHFGRPDAVVLVWMLPSVEPLTV